MLSSENLFMGGLIHFEEVEVAILSKKFTLHL